MSDTNNLKRSLAKLYLSVLHNKMKQFNDKLHGGNADGLTPDQFPPDLVLEGALHELEHTDDIEIAAKIAIDHLVEDQNYYKKLKQIEPGELEKEESLDFSNGVKLWPHFVFNLKPHQSEQMMMSEDIPERLEKGFKAWAIAGALALGTLAAPHTASAHAGHVNQYINNLKDIPGIHVQSNYSPEHATTQSKVKVGKFSVNVHAFGGGNAGISDHKIDLIGPKDMSSWSSQDHKDYNNAKFVHQHLTGHIDKLMSMTGKVGKTESLIKEQQDPRNPNSIHGWISPDGKVPTLAPNINSESINNSIHDHLQPHDIINILANKGEHAELINSHHPLTNEQNQAILISYPKDQDFLHTIAAHHSDGSAIESDGKNHKKYHYEGEHAGHLQNGYGIKLGDDHKRQSFERDGLKFVHLFLNNNHQPFEEKHIEDPKLETNQEVKKSEEIFETLEKAKKDDHLKMYPQEQQESAKPFVDWAAKTLPNQNWALWAIRNHRQDPSKFTPDVLKEIEHFAGSQHIPDIKSIRLEKEHNLDTGLKLFKEAEAKYNNKIKNDTNLVEPDEKISQILDSNANYRNKIHSLMVSKNSKHISQALDDRDYRVREAAIKNPNATTEHISQALNDNDADVRYRAIQHPNATAEHIDKALEDKDDDVRQVAQKIAKQKFPHLLNPKSTINNPTKLAASEDIIQNLNKTRGRLSFPKVPQLPSRPDQEVMPIHTQRQADMHSKLVANKIKNWTDKVKQYTGQQLTPPTINTSTVLNPASNMSGITTHYGDTVAAAYNPNVTNSDMVKEHEGMHYLLGQLQDKFGKAAKDKVIDRMLKKVHAHDQAFIKRGLYMDSKNYQDSPYLKEEMLNRVSDIVNNRPLRSRYKEHDFKQSAVEKKLPSHLHEDIKHADKFDFNRLSNSWNKILNEGKKITTRYLKTKTKKSESNGGLNE